MSNYLPRGMLIATGAKYRTLSTVGCGRFEGLGLHYATSKAETQRYAGAEVAFVGVGHSAGQAAVFLSILGHGVSRCLSRRIETSGNIEVLYRTKIRRAVGEGGGLNGIEVEDAGRKQRRTLRVRVVFSLIRAVPHTDQQSNFPSSLHAECRGRFVFGPVDSLVQFMDKVGYSEPSTGGFLSAIFRSAGSNQFPPKRVADSRRPRTPSFTCCFQVDRLAGHGGRHK